MNKIMWHSIILLMFLCTFSARTAVAITSYDFNSPTLNESLWTKINPLNDSNYSMVQIFLVL